MDIEIGAIASGSIRSVRAFLVGDNKIINVEGIGTSVEAGEKIYFENGGVFVLSDPAGKGSTELMGQLHYANVGVFEDGTITSEIVVSEVSASKKKLIIKPARTSIYAGQKIFLGDEVYFDVSQYASAGSTDLVGVLHGDQIAVGSREVPRTHIATHVNKLTMDVRVRDNVLIQQPGYPLNVEKVDIADGKLEIENLNSNQVPGKRVENAEVDDNCNLILNKLTVRGSKVGSNIRVVSGGDIAVGDVRVPGFTNRLGDIFLNAAGEIVPHFLNTGINLVADDLEMVAGSDIKGLDIQAKKTSRLLSRTGDIDIHLFNHDQDRAEGSRNGVVVREVSAPLGSISIDSEGALQVLNLYAGDQLEGGNEMVTLSSRTDNLEIGESAIGITSVHLPKLIMMQPLIRSMKPKS